MLIRSRPVQLRPGTMELRGRIAQLGLVTKAGVAPIAATDLAVGFSNPELFLPIESGSIIGRLQQIRRVPFLRRLLHSTEAARAYWVGGALRAKPVSRFDLEGLALPPLTIASIIPMTDEAVQFSDPLTDQAIRNDTVRASIERLDQSFIDVANAGVADVEPASVTNGSEQIPSTGDPARDVPAAVEAFAGNLDSAYWITDPLTATRIGCYRDANGALMFDVGARGGELLTIPVITSRGSPIDSSGGQLSLIDAGSIAVALDGVDITEAKSATLEMVDNPDSTPDATVVQVSLFQMNLVALRAVMHANWSLQRTGAVVTITGCLYPAS